MFNFTETTEKTLNEKRQEYGETLTNRILAIVAQDILDGTPRDVAGNRLEYFAKKCNPGVKAEVVEAGVNEALDATLDRINSEAEATAKKK